MGRDPEVQALLDALAAGIRDALGDDLVGVYVRGSLALGGFDPATSDIDLLTVVERPVSDGQFDALAALHGRVARSGSRYADHLEVSYIDRRSIRQFRPAERRHPSIGTDWPFGWHEHRDNWTIERRVLRGHGGTLPRPHPRPPLHPGNHPPVP